MSGLGLSPTHYHNIRKFVSPESGIVQSGVRDLKASQFGVVECGVRSPRSLLILDSDVRFTESGDWDVRIGHRS